MVKEAITYLGFNLLSGRKALLLISLLVRWW